MTMKISKVAVQIVCPHCRRTYVIKVNLKRIYQTKPRAICSRCGGKFEVIQRMSEIEEPLESIRTAPRKSRKRKSQREKEPGQPTTRRTPAIEAPPKPEAQLLRQLSVNEATTRAARLAAKVPTTSQRAKAPPAPQKGEDFHTKKTVPTFSEDETSKIREAIASSVPPPSPSPVWAALTDGQTPSGIRLPGIDDLNAPLPWISQVSSSLEHLDAELPESAEVLVWLLTERTTRPRGASPPPIPFDAEGRDSSTPTPKPPAAEPE